MLFGQAVENIYSRIKRPDKALECGDAINRAIGLFTTSTWFTDLVELTAPLESDEYIQSLDISTTPYARFRKIKYIRPTNYRQFLSWMDPSRIWAHGCENVNVWYRAGNRIQFKLSTKNSTAELGYYQYPAVLEDDADENWMLDQIWPAVQAYALAEMFADIGQDQDAANYGRRWPILLQAYHRDIGDAVSYG